MATQVLTQGRDDGAQIGTAATEKVGFFGATPVVQQDDVSIAITATTMTVATSIATAIGEINTALKNLGLTA